MMMIYTLDVSTTRIKNAASTYFQPCSLLTLEVTLRLLGMLTVDGEETLFYCEP